MGRRKIEIKPIKDDRNRSVTFLKRKGGLFKKAHELSVLCSVDVAVIIFGSNKKLYEYSSIDMPELLHRYSYHGGLSEHKGPNDFNEGDSDDDADGTPPPAEMIEAHMMPAHFPPQAPPQFANQYRHHTPSASPPIPSGVGFAPHPAAVQVMQRGHTPQPVGSRPGSRNDVRRMPQGQPGNGYAYMPPQNMYNGPVQQMPPMTQGGQQFSYAAPTTHAPHSLPQFAEERPSSLPPNYPPNTQASSLPPPAPIPQRHSVSPPQVHVQHPAQPNSRSETPQGNFLPPPPPPQQPQQPQHQEHQEHKASDMNPPAMAPQVPESEQPRPVEIKKLPQRKNQTYSIFTPIDESRSILSQHLDAFRSSEVKKEDSDNGARAASHESGSSSPPAVRDGDAASSQMSQPPLPVPKPRASVSSVSDSVFTPPSRQNSLRPSGGGRPRLRVEIPPDGSEEGSTGTATGTGTGTGSASSPRNTGDSAQNSVRRNGETHNGIVLPPPSPSAASALLSAGASGPPNPFARPAPPQQSNNSMHIDTPGSALPSRFMNNELLPSPSSFYPEWGFGRNNDATLPSPLNFQTPVVGSGPSFLRDDGPTTNKRKSPDAAAGQASDPAEKGEKGDSKRIKVE